MRIEPARVVGWQRRDAGHSHEPVRSPVRALVTALTMAVLLGANGPALAQPGPWSVGAALGASHDSNIYRLADGASLPAGLSRADTISTVSLLGSLDQPIGRQRVLGSASLRNNHYASNAALDNSGYGLNLGLDWATVEKLSGRLSLQANREQTFFNPDSSLSTLLGQNIGRTQQFDSSVRLGLVSRWQAEATLGWRRTDYSATEYRSREIVQSSASLGLRWRPSAALEFGAAWRQAQGRYPHFFSRPGAADLADRFARQDLELSSDWFATGASTLNARLNIGRVRFSAATQRDFNGLTGELRWVWRPTAKLTLIHSALREAGQDAARTSAAFITSTDSSRVSNTLRSRAEFDLSAKMRLTLGASVSQRALVDSSQTFFGSTLVQSGSDHSRDLTLGLLWTVSRALQLGCDFSQQRRTSNTALAAPFGVQVIGCNGQFVIH